MNNILITVIGPTAIGKTSLAIKLAKHYKTEIISADSRQFYRELNIGTAKPSNEELSSVKHHLINNISIKDEYNISQFELDARKKIKDLFKTKDTVIMVGGSGLYIETVLYGIDEIPNVDFSVREKLNIEFLKLQFNSQSGFKINNYTIDLNSRVLLKNHTKLKLTEKEINTIVYLSKSEKPVSIDELQQKVWSYQSDIETHTVETHIYRLRKKIFNSFDDDNFIVSKKDGYQIK